MYEDVIASCGTRVRVDFGFWEYFLLLVVLDGTPGIEYYHFNVWVFTVE